MGTEIERKFIINKNKLIDLPNGILYRQGYLSTSKERTVRIRVFSKKAYITIKGLSQGASRLEYEYEIPFKDGNEMLDKLCKKPVIEKIRHKYLYEDFIWEIDVFLGENKGLILAEIELEKEDAFFKKPSWIGNEVTGDPKYYNSSLIKNPYKNW
ncbi:CYTH domain-containing protein [Herbivorax sp. ANBcel31]|uniref:CYTH domain-containing protein n=1 Tax=Herbivorax sp. ANBcel31 TaxID=3069754 RepID=UPI0027B4DC86|nr:CYTH domain-containing protein [Herbivorax sp. ANBcel31]MDQ2086383.1 CYTH domain-containing protein [Herbivorax sp. ANBcel31]